MLKIKYLCAIAALTAAPLVASQELSDTGEFVDGIAAVVNEGVVLKSQLRTEVASIVLRAGQENLQLPPADVLSEQVLERLILTEVQLQRAQHKKGGGWRYSPGQPGDMSVTGWVFLAIRGAQLAGITQPRYGTGYRRTDREAGHCYKAPW